MRPHDPITYVDASGDHHPAFVVAITGAGPSNYKTLDVSVDGETIREVPHFKDKKPGAGYWLQLTETDEPPAAEQAEKAEE